MKRSFMVLGLLMMFAVGTIAIQQWGLRMTIGNIIIVLAVVGMTTWPIFLVASYYTEKKKLGWAVYRGILYLYAWLSFVLWFSKFGNIATYYAAQLSYKYQWRWQLSYWYPFDYEIRLVTAGGIVCIATTLVLTVRFIARRRKH